jgi:hypothetical protein
MPEIVRIRIMATPEQADQIVEKLRTLPEIEVKTVSVPYKNRRGDPDQVRIYIEAIGR